MITDDEDDMEPEAFRAEMQELLGHDLVQHAIASENFHDTPCYRESPDCPVVPGVPPIPAVCGAAAIGRRYYALANATGGETCSVCATDWGPRSMI